MKDVYRKDYFFQIHNKIIKRQLNRQLNKVVIEQECDGWHHHMTSLWRELADGRAGASPSTIKVEAYPLLSFSLPFFCSLVF